MKSNFLFHLFGTYDLPYFLSAVCFAMLGAIISLLIHASNRDKNSMRAPYKFNFLFLVQDNWQRVALNIILILVTVRFCEEITGKQLTMFAALTIGITYDKILELLRNKCVIDTK